MKNIEFKFPLKNGLHARPASSFEEIANRFSSEICCLNSTSGGKANCCSAIALIGLDILFNERCEIIIQGEDESLAYKEIAKFIKEELPYLDDSVIDELSTF